MKYLVKLFFMSLVLTLSVQGFSAVSVAPSKAKEVKLTDQLTESDILNLSSKEIEQKIGKKLKFKEKVALKVAKKNIKRIKAGKKPFDGIGFILGLFLGLIGVLVAYLVLEEDRPGAGRSSLFGLLTAVGIAILLAIILLAGTAAVAM